MSSLPQRLSLLLVLYLAQGIPFGVYTQALPAILRTYDVPLSLISLSGLLAVPWALKMFWAPWVDRYYWPTIGHRRSWILAMNLGLSTVMFGLCWFDPDSLRQSSGVWTLFVLLFLVNLFAATQDIATDGLAVRILSHHERGLGNGVQVSAYRVGVICGGGLLLLVLDELGWALAFSGLALMSLLLLLPVLLFREPAPDPSVVAARDEPMFAAWKSFFKRPELQGWIWVLVTYKIADSLSAGLVKPMMIDMGMSLSDIGAKVSMLSAVTTILGAMLGGWWMTYLKRRTALVGFGAAQSISIFLYAFAAWQLSATAAIWANAIEHFTGGMATAALLAVVMDRARLAHAGVDFTLQVSLLAAFGGSFYLPAGLLAEQIGYVAHFMVSGLLGLFVLTVAWRYTREPEELGGDALRQGQS